MVIPWGDRTFAAVTMQERCCQRQGERETTGGKGLEAASTGHWLPCHRLRYELCLREEREPLEAGQSEEDREKHELGTCSRRQAQGAPTWVADVYLWAGTSSYLCVPTP